jgi:hypothetical protein
MTYRIDDMVEVSPGEWATPAEAQLLRAQRAAARAIPDFNKDKRRRTPDDIPNLGSPIEFWTVIACMFLFAYFFR